MLKKYCNGVSIQVIQTSRVIRKQSLKKVSKSECSQSPAQQNWIAENGYPAANMTSKSASGVRG